MIMGVCYVNNNGTILPDTSPTIMPKNRSYMYGDGVFETIRIVNGKPINIENHIAMTWKQSCKHLNLA